ncbi:hypothetical protein T03_11961 [Trichinella britovi]|uniref:Uncharacterized protein n=1 Tax=Trichinella britovi TaxID=45882 RepID=A0A0V0ZBX9_TRIBR|nr:hypothetical protein T03_11961 [Trichinella britovi]
MVSLGLNFVPIRSHCSFIGRCPRYFINYVTLIVVT